MEQHAAAQLGGPGAGAYIALGLVVGLLAGLFGVGGGFLLTPLLHVLFGLPYGVAVGTGLAQMAVMSWAGTWEHVRLRHVDFRLGLALIAGSFLGAESGVRVQKILRQSGDIVIAGRLMPAFDLGMAFLFVVLLVSMGWAMAIEGRRAARRAAGGSVRAAAGQEAEITAGSEPDEGGPKAAEPRPTALSRWLARVQVRPSIALAHAPEREISVWVPAGVGYAVAILTGLLGVGGGFLNMPIMIYGLNVPTVVAIGTASLVTSAVAVYSGLRYVMQGMVLWPAAGLLLVGSLIGVRLGARLSHRLPGDRLRRYFAYTVMGTAAVIVLDAVRKIYF